MPRLSRLLGAALLAASAAGAAGARAEVADHDSEHVARDRVLAAARHPAETLGEMPLWYGDRKRVGPEEACPAPPEPSQLRNYPNLG